jgi:Large polyvalent protein associated domain 38
MANYLPLPDGSRLRIPEGMSENEAMQKARVKFPDLFPKQGGMAGAFGKGLESTLSSMRTGLGALTSPEEAAQAGAQRGQDINSRYAEEVSFDKVREAYDKNGILSAAREALGQVPKAIAEQAPNIGATLGGARLGAMAGSLAGPAGTVVGGVAGALAPSLLQQFGGNIERQQAEGAPINRGAAAAAAVPQAALDAAGTFIPLGGQLVSKLTGIPIKGLANKGAAKLAEESLSKTLLKGTGVGALAEIPTEVAQQMLERAQAGLSLTSPDALKEYGETAYQVGLLAPIGAAGRFSEKGAAQQKLKEEQDAKDLAAAEEANKEPLQIGYTPQIAGPNAEPRFEIAPQPKPDVMDLIGKHDALVPQMDALQEQIKEAGVAGDTAKLAELMPQFDKIQTDMQLLTATVEQLGGTTKPAADLQTEAQTQLAQANKQVAAAQKALAKASELGEWQQIPKLSAKLDAARQNVTAIQEKTQQQLQMRQVAETPKGETPGLFEKPPEQPEQQAKAQEVLQAEAERGLYGPESKAESAKQAFAEAEVGPRGQLEAAPAEHVASKDKDTLDLFSPSNLYNTALENQDWEGAVKAAEAANREAPQKKDTNAEAIERERLIKQLDERLNLPGLKSTRVAPEVVAKTMDKIDALKRKVENPQRNAKKSWLTDLYESAADYEAMAARMKSGVALPTEAEKVARLDAKLGKGKAPEVRQMDAAERYQLQRKMDSALKRYENALAKITPVRNEIEKAYSSLFNVESAAPERDVREAKKAEADEEARGAKPVSRAARTAARINRGDVAPEAEKTAKMQELATKLGKETEDFKRIAKNLDARVAKLQEKYGKGDYRVSEYKEFADIEKRSKAQELGRKSPEYKTALKEQVKYLQEVYASAGKQTVKSKRDKSPVMRKQSAAPERFVTSSPESRAISAAKHERSTESIRRSKTDEQIAEEAYMKYLRDAREALDSENDGTYGEGNWRTGPRTNGIKLDEAQKVIDGLKLPKGIKFVYAESLDDAPKEFYMEAAAQGLKHMDLLDKKGVVLKDGTVIVIGAHHANVKDLEATIAHELIGHYSVQGLLGKKGMIDLMKTIDTQPGGVLKLADDLGVGIQVRNAIAEAKESGANDLDSRFVGLQEMLAYVEEQRVTEDFLAKAKRFMKEIVGAVRKAFRDMGLLNTAELSTSDMYKLLRDARKQFNEGSTGAYRDPNGGLLFRSGAKSTAKHSITAKPSTLKDKIKANFFGLGARQQFVDSYASIDSAIRAGMDKKMLTSMEGEQAMYYLRFTEQRSQYVGQFVTNGPVSLESQKTPRGTEYVFKSKKGPNLMKVAELAGKSGLGNEATIEDYLTSYLVGQRANAVGWSKLGKSEKEARAAYQEVMDKLAANPKAKTAFEAAAKEYKAYNDGLIDFLAQSGAISRGKAAELKSKPYVPFYREKDGNVELVVDGESILRIGNIKNQPQLKELLGGDEKVMPLYESAMQNTAMITDMALRNIKTKNTAYALKKVGIVSRMGDGKGPADPSIVRFFEHGEPRYAVVDKDAFGIPAELVVKSMEGIATTIPAVVRLMGYPSDWLRKFVTRNPAYAVRQAIRDPLSAWLTTGTDSMPVLSSLKELSKMVGGRSDAETKLMESGAISSNVFTGDSKDLKTFLRDISSGKSGWEKAMAKLDAFALQGDSSTRAVIYNEAIKQGMTEMQALTRTLESMNFSRRGLSPSMQVLSTLIPFFNAQIQGLDVLYRAYKGQMPFEKQLQVREKMLKRGTMLAVAAIAYAALMQDDEAYKNAKPEERYGNFFLSIPGIDEPMRIPLPFELGYIFKALPEAIYNMAVGDEKADKAMLGIGKLFAQSNPFGLPQAIKPAAEVILGKSFYSGDIESARDLQVLPTERYRDNTSELSKMIGSVTGEVGLSPVKLDYLIRGYFGSLGVALAQLANPILEKTPEQVVAKPSTKVSQMPIIGSLFQPIEGRGPIDEAYAKMEEIKQAKGTFTRLAEQGKLAEARAFAQQYATELSMASTSGTVYKRLGELSKQERAVKASANMSTAQKDEAIKRIEQAKISLARMLNQASDRAAETKPQ